MPEVNIPDLKAHTDTLFPITVKFEADGHVRYRVCMGLDERKDDDFTDIHLVSGYLKNGIYIKCIRTGIDEIFNECVMAKQEGRFADFTKLEQVPEPKT